MGAIFRFTAKITRSTTDIPAANLPVMAETGSDGISRGRIKFKITAQTNVIKNHISFLPKYFR